MKAVVLAGGEATRLRPLTCNTPKVMVPVLNRPFLEHLIGYLKRHNIVDIILAAGRLPGQVVDYFGDGSQFGVRLAYSTEGFPMGTAGAVKNAQGLIDDAFFVFNGDVFTDIDLSDMMRLHRRNRAIASLALTPVDDPTIYGVVETDSQGIIRRFLEKPNRDEVTTTMINAGIYILEPDILDFITPDAFSMFERDVFPPLLETDHVMYSYPSHDYWIDMGTPEKYLKLQHDLLLRPRNQAVEFEGEASVHPSARIQGPAIIGEGCSIDRNSVIIGPAVLGARCHVGAHAVIEGAVLWSDCRVGSRARLRNCLVACACQISEESEVPEGCVLGDEIRIVKGTRLSDGLEVWPGNSVSSDTLPL